MKIAFVIPTLMHGGAERVVSNLANYYVLQGHEVEIILFYEDSIWYSVDERVKIVINYGHTGKRNLLVNMVWFREYVKAAKFDVIYSFLAMMNIFSILSLAGLCKNLVVADRSDPRYCPSNRVIRKIRDYLYCFADSVVVQNQMNLSYFPQKVREKCSVIYNPISIEESVVQEKKEPRHEIIYVGRILRQKNPEMLLHAFSKLATDFPEYFLSYYGDGEYIDELKNKTQELGLTSRVCFHGSVKNIYECMKNAEIFCLTSNYEGMPNALIEAMCLGLPVVATKVSGATELIADGLNGYLVNCGDENQLTERLRSLMLSEEKRESFGKEAESIRDKLQIETIAAQWLKLAIKK